MTETTRVESLEPDLVEASGGTTMTLKSIQINGESTNTSFENLAELIQEQYPNNPAIAVAINNTVIPKSQWSTQALQAGDHIEIIQAVCGG